MPIMSVVADQGEGFSHMWSDGWGTAWGAWWMVLLWAVMLGFVIWAIVALTRGGRDQQPRTPPPRQLLDQRFAAGEIDQDEYQQARRLLAERDPSTY